MSAEPGWQDRRGMNRSARADGGLGESETADELRPPLENKVQTAPEDQTGVDNGKIARRK